MIHDIEKLHLEMVKSIAGPMLATVDNEGYPVYNEEDINKKALRLTSILFEQSYFVVNENVRADFENILNNVWQHTERIIGMINTDCVWKHIVSEMHDLQNEITELRNYTFAKEYFN